MDKQAEDHPKKQPYYPSLPSVEVVIYLIVYSGVIFGSIFTLLSLSRENEYRYSAVYGRLTQGWKWLTGHYKDTVDFEWSFWEEHLWKTVVLGFTGHFLVARIADAILPNRRFKVYFFYSLFFTIYYLGISGMLFIVSHFLVQYSVAVLLKSVKMCWLTGCLLAYSIVNERCVASVKQLYNGDFNRSYFLLFTAAMCNLRYIAFSIEYVWSCNNEKDLTPKSSHENSYAITEFGDGNDIRQRKSLVKQTHGSKTKPAANSSNPLPLSFFDLLVYQMYFPLFYGGPVINYNEFARQLKRPPRLWSAGSTKIFVLGMIHFIFWHLVTDFVLHFFYVSALSTDSKLLQNLPLFKLFGLALAQVTFFCLKYVCMYGISSHFATSDNMDIPKGPHCVFAKHRVTDMWKYFDKGLHLWLVRYIYIPCGGSKAGTCRSILNSVLPFAFVCFWHGAYPSQIYWAASSWIGVFLEAYALKLYNTEQVKSFELKYLSPTWSRRVRAFLSAPLLFLLLTSNLYFLSGVAIAHMYWRRLYLENFCATALFLVFFYCGCQSCMEFDRLAVKQL